MDGLTRREREKHLREEEIILAAEKVFCLKGFEDASMDEISKEAQFTKRTLYQYFTNKEDLYFAVVLKGFKRLSSYLQDGSKTQDTGYMKIHQSCIGFYKFYRDYPEILRLISYMGHVKKKSNNDSKRLQELMQFDNELFKTTAEVIAEGKADGSIRSDLDPQKTSFSLIFLMTGFLNQISTSGSTFTKYFSLDLEDFCLFSMDFLFRAIKGSKE